MPGSPSRSRLGTAVGIAFAAIGLVGFVVFDWRFDGSSGPFPLALAALAVLLAVGLQLVGD